MIFCYVFHIILVIKNTKMGIAIIKKKKKHLNSLKSWHAFSPHIEKWLLPFLLVLLPPSMLLKYSLDKMPFEQDTNLFDSNSFMHNTVRESWAACEEDEQRKRKRKFEEEEEEKLTSIISPS